MDQALLAVTATFTAEPLDDALAFWIEELGLDLRPAFAPYNQVFQQLLDPGSVVGQNRGGVSVVLARPADWLRYGGEAASQGAEAFVQRSLDELADALAAAAERSPAPILCVICPSPSDALAAPGLEARLRASVADRRNVHVLAHAELAALYPVREVHDPHADAIGHIPYTKAYFAALGTLLARKVHALRSPPRKVIAVDCDDTLWKGVVGEVGPMGVEIDPPRRALHELLVAQKESGVLLCVVSKNDEADALEVWKHRPEMPLKREDIVGARVNWRPKSENLRSLADELRLGLDSFVFLDDNPVERAEVAARCPEVLVLDLPADAAEIPSFLRHVWALDHLHVTEEDRRRTALYQENAARERARREAPALADFLAGLELVVTITAPGPAQIARAAQLTQRTNQFNTTTIRRTEAEIDALARSGEAVVRIVEVRDRFGDYGIVGVIVARPAEGALEVDSLLLSCRVLGRGVENRMLRALGEIASASGLARVDVRFTPSRKNQPARDFLDAAGAAFREADEAGAVYRFPTEIAASLPLLPFVAEVAADEGAPTKAAPSGVEAPSASMSRIARELRDVDAILAAIDAGRRQRGPAAETTGERTPIEETIAGIWSDVLGIEPIDLDKDFFDLGGDSLHAAQVIARLRQAFHVSLEIDVLFASPATVAALAVKIVEQLAAEEADPDEVAGLLAELEGS